MVTFFQKANQKRRELPAFSYLTNSSYTATTLSQISATLMDTSWLILTATADDIPALQALIQLSGRELSVGFYTPEQIESVNHYVFGVDSSLIDDGSYFLVRDENTLIACGGWSQRRTLYGGDQRRIGKPEKLDPMLEPARIRAFFVHPDYARKGLGMALLHHCEQAALSAGFSALELIATLPGVPLYQRGGFVEVEQVFDTLPNGVVIPFIKMRKNLR